MDVPLGATATSEDDDLAPSIFYVRATSSSSFLVCISTWAIAAIGSFKRLTSKTFSIFNLKKVPLLFESWMWRGRSKNLDVRRLRSIPTPVINYLDQCFTSLFHT